MLCSVRFGFAVRAERSCRAAASKPKHVSADQSVFTESPRQKKNSHSAKLHKTCACTSNAVASFVFRCFVTVATADYCLAVDFSRHLCRSSGGGQSPALRSSVHEYTNYGMWASQNILANDAPNNSAMKH